jgi:citrate lyase synthetase
VPTGGSASRFGEAFDSVPAGARQCAVIVLNANGATVGHSNRVTVSFGTL